MKWTDTLEIAMALAEAHPDVDPATVRFTELRRYVLELPGFNDDPAHSGELRGRPQVQLSGVKEVTRDLDDRLLLREAGIL